MSDEMRTSREQETAATTTTTTATTSSPGDSEQQQRHEPTTATAQSRSRLRIVTDCIKYAIASITLTNMTKVFLLYQLFSYMKGDSSGGPEIPQEAEVYHPPQSQHFVLEPVGYTYSYSYSTGPSVRDAFGEMRKRSHSGGYYQIDAMAFNEALAKAPVYSAPPAVTTTSVCAADDDVARVCRAEDIESHEKKRGLTETQEDSNKENEDHHAAQSESEKVLDNSNATDNITASSRVLRTISRPQPGTVIVLELKLGVDPSGTAGFVRSAITFLIGHVRDQRAAATANKEPTGSFEVVVLLESTGGEVSSYGLVAEQLRRLRIEPGITLTICCDQTALSGGYLLASLASPGQLLAAPFALIGSIGVMTPDILNLSDLLEDWGVKAIRFKGGKKKLQPDSFGALTEEEVKDMQDHIDAVHSAFRDHVKRWRGDAISDYDFATTGAHWVGKDALEIGLVDRLTTSDEYIDERVRSGNRVLRLRGHKGEKSTPKRVLSAILDSFSSSPGASSMVSDSMIRDRVDVRYSVSRAFEKLVDYAEAIAGWIE